MEQAFDESLKQVIDFCKTNKQVDLEWYGLKELHDMAMVTMLKDDESVAVMKYFFYKIYKLTKQIQFFDIGDLRFNYGIEGDEAKNYWFSKNFWSKYDKLAYNCLFNSYPKEWMITEQGNYHML